MTFLRQNRLFSDSWRLSIFLLNHYSYPAVRRADVAREMYITSIGCTTCLPGTDYPPAGHPDDYKFYWTKGRVMGDFALVWLESGSGMIEASGISSTELLPGQVLFLPPGTWHRYRPASATGWVEKWVCLNGAYLHRLAAKHVFPTRAAIYNRQALSQAMEQLFGRIYTSADHNSLSMAGLAFALFALVVNPTEEPLPDVGSEVSSGDKLVDTAVGYIWSHAHRQISVDEVARRIGVSRRSLERAFKACWSCGVAGELERARLERGRDLLAESGMSVKEAGYAAGFDGARRFIDSHRRVYGVTPGKLSTNTLSK